MPRKTGSLRGPTPTTENFKKLSEDLTRFVRANVKDADRAIAAMQASPPTPERPRVQPEDLLAAPPVPGLRSQFDQGPGVTEVHGPLMAPQTVLRHSHANSPAPSVSTNPPQAYTEVGAGRER